jgi:hypothetical protein
MDWPCWLEKLPMAQPEHTVAPRDPVAVPVSHSRHLPWPVSGLYWPAAQRSQRTAPEVSLTPPAAKRPTAQGWQETVPVPFAYRPAGQRRQLARPEVRASWPIGHNCDEGHNKELVGASRKQSQGGRDTQNTRPHNA